MACLASSARASLQHADTQQDRLYDEPRFLRAARTPSSPAFAVLRMPRRAVPGRTEANSPVGSGPTSQNVKLRLFSHVVRPSQRSTVLIVVIARPGNSKGGRRIGSEGAQSHQQSSGVSPIRSGHSQHDVCDTVELHSLHQYSGYRSPSKFDAEFGFPRCAISADGGQPRLHSQ